MKRGQNGFGVVETLLVLILLSILGFTGYYVYHSRNNANSTYNTAAQSSSSTAPPSSERFNLGLYNASLILPQKLKGMTVSKITDTSCPTGTVCRVYYALKHPDFTEANNRCYGQSPNNDQAAFATISGSGGQFNQESEPTAGLLKQFNDHNGYYITISYPNGITYGCSTGIDGSTVQKEAHELQTAFVTAFQQTGTASP